LPASIQAIAAGNIETTFLYFVLNITLAREPLIASAVRIHFQ